MGTPQKLQNAGRRVEAVLKDFYSQNREIKAEDYLVPENKGEYLDMAFANVTSFLYVRSEPTKESDMSESCIRDTRRRSQVLWENGRQSSREMSPDM